VDQQTIQAIAGEVARHLPNVWVLLLIQALLTLLAAGGGAYFGEYLRTRGRNLATKADFESLQNQLRANTELVETIRSEVGQKDWARREWTNLRRIKLEFLMQRLHDCDDYLDRYRSAALGGNSLAERDPRDELDTIAALYFPELEPEEYAFSLAFMEQKGLILQLGQEMQEAGSDLAARQQVFARFNVKWFEQYPARRRASKKLVEAARWLLVNIMDVDVSGDARPQRDGEDGGGDERGAA
jgi:hypothetical protein